MTKPSHAKAVGSKHDWQWGHRGKRSYLTKRQARIAMVRLWVVKRHFMLRAYPCAWGPRYESGMTRTPHWHLGHRPRWMARSKRRRFIHHWSHTLTIWAFYRLRRRVRAWWRLRHAG